MKLNLKRGVLGGLIGLAVSAVFCALIWSATLPKKYLGHWTFIDSVREWWQQPAASMQLFLMTVVCGAFGLLGFIMGALRPTPSPRGDNKTSTLLS